MCGIIGIINRRKDEFSNEFSKRIEKGLSLLQHRGPNASAFKIFKGVGVALGHVRLSVLDIDSRSNQPMQVGENWIVYNGEVYNYVELREELEREGGFAFSTNGDTEVVARAYEYWGEDCVKHFNGMWGFAIFNVRTNTVFCSRDRYGVKPFNYYLSDEYFIFSSEVKAILAINPKLAVPNYNSIALFAREGICAELEDTWFEKIKRLAPGENIILSPQGTRLWRWYDFPTHINNELTFDCACETFRRLFEDAVRIRLRSDVPIGTTLSGGLDSSAIAGMLRSIHETQIEAYTACFSNFRDDESIQARRTISEFGLGENFVDCGYDSKTYLPVLRKIIWHLESGHASTSIFPLWKIYESAKDKLTVILEGQGADENLAGYIDGAVGFEFIENCLRKGQVFRAVKTLFSFIKNYSLKNMAIIYLRVKLPNGIRSFARRVYLKTEKIFDKDSCRLKKFYYPRERPRKYSKDRFIAALQRSHAYGLTSLLHYGDAISMAFSMENRLPFMDYRLVDFVFSCPPDFLVRGGMGKAILRDALASYLPAGLNSNPLKRGFPSPICDFLDREREMVTKLLLSPIATNRNLYDAESLSQVLGMKGAEWKNAHRLVFRLLCVELWFQEFIDNKESVYL